MNHDDEMTLRAQSDWYFEMAQENEAVAQRLETVCVMVLEQLDGFGKADTFEKAMRRLTKARTLLRERHGQ